MDYSTITTGVTGDGRKNLELFLQEYTSIFNEKVNPGCPKCLTSYIDRYKNHFAMKDNTSKYRLHLKYENIPLEFGSPILVNNGNITDEYAQKLLEQEDGKRFFSVIPEPTEPEAPKATAESLQKALDDAQAAFDGLADNAHHMTRKAKENALQEAKDALENFNAEQAAAKELEVVLNEDDFANTPELKEEYKLGDTVIVDRKELEVNGITKVLRRKE